MNGEWTAASVRAGALARQRLGAGRCRELAAQPGLLAALGQLRPSVYGPYLVDAASLDDAAHATRVAVLWQLRVLAGWFPPTGGRLAHALAAGFERDNIVGLGARLSGRAAPPAFELGALATAWPRLREIDSSKGLDEALSHTVWGTVADGLPLRDRLTLAWLRRLESSCPATRRWHELALATLIARCRLLDRSLPQALRDAARPIVGTAWETARTIRELLEALPSRLRVIFEGIRSPDELWRAEARLQRIVEDDAFAWVRSPRPGPEAIVGSIAVLTADARRVRAALASAALGGRMREDLDVVA